MLIAMIWRIRVPLSEADPDGPCVWGSTDYFVGRPESDGKVYDGVVDWKMIRWEDEPTDEF
jgi:hypothetical protein